ncbi:MAG: hypothetical protein HY913_11480 [Desulfomonile tiedjei]|nr:hypothetical protein [Desulfomonile tiedjei]
MSDRTKSRPPAVLTAEVQVPFKYAIVHGGSPSRRSAEQKAQTRSLNLMGLVFETSDMEKDGLHLSFADSTYGRNSLEIKLDLGKKFRTVEVVGQVEWYERRSTAMGHAFIVGVGFLDVAADVLSLLRDYLQQVRGLLE